MNHEPNDINESIMKKLRVLNWTGRLLTTVALCVGLLAIAGGIVLTMACPRIIFPQVQLLLKQSTAQHANGTNSNSSAVTNAPNPMLTLSDGSVVDQQTLVTLMFGKALDVMSLAITILGLGAMLTLLLVIFNRRVTLRQINVSLVQISQQIKELQDRGQRPS